MSCSLVAVALHYLFLAAFCWMTVEGHHLYRMVVTVFDSGRDFRRWYLLMGYGVPAVVVLVTKMVAICRDEKAYGRDELYVRYSLQDRNFICGMKSNSIFRIMFVWQAAKVIHIVSTFRSALWKITHELLDRYAIRVLTISCSSIIIVHKLVYKEFTKNISKIKSI